MKDKNSESVPETCKGCYRWEHWRNTCSYYWGKKKECGSKVTNHEEMLGLDQMRRR